MNNFVAGNRIRLLRTGAEYFPALEAAIDGAHRQIHLETYIFEADATGHALTLASPEEMKNLKALEAKLTELRGDGWK